MKQVLVVSATVAEATYVPADVPLLVTGIGKTAAAASTARALASYVDPSTVTVLNVGTAGALRPGLEGLHEVATVLNHDISADLLRALGYDAQERLELDGAAGAVLATGDVFVTDPVVRDRLAGVADLVDMEGYAVAWAAREAGAPCRVVKHVSDNADQEAMDWPAVVDRSARVLGDWVQGWVSGSC